MVFSSLSFIYYFLPLTLIVYFLSKGETKNYVLLLASLIFYYWGEKRYILFMLASIILAYISGQIIDRNSNEKIRKTALILFVVFSISMLGYFKYANFFIESFNAVTGLSIKLLKVTLPIGISFYTFQAIGYVVDVYRKDVSAQNNFFYLALYISMFPQLVAGPIVRYKDIESQLVERKHPLEKIEEGAEIFICGLSKKILLANMLGEISAAFKVSKDLSVLFVWLYAVSYFLQIYFDFSGYSDMAIGLGKILGFDFMKNFDYPYISSSITEFWRRWHISLGSWFRDYVYIPLGGNRVNRSRHLLNIFAVWLLTGFWHGANYTFIIWGLYFGVLLVIEKYGLLDYLNSHKVFAHIYVILAVIIGFVIFDGDSMHSVMEVLKSMFLINGLPLISFEALYYLNSYKIVLALSILFVTPLPGSLLNRLNSSYIKAVVYILLLLVSTAFLVDGSFNPFLYFRF